MGYHPPRHAATRAALGVQAAHATLSMRPHMPPSSPWHTNTKRAHPRHRWEPSHATAITSCPVHIAPRTRPMPPMRTHPPSHATSALLTHSIPSLLVSARLFERTCCLRKTCQWPTSWLTPRAHPCPLPDVAHRKAHGCPSPHATRALPGHLAPSRLVEELSSPRASMLP